MSKISHLIKVSQDGSGSSVNWAAFKLYFYLHFHLYPFKQCRISILMIKLAECCQSTAKEEKLLQVEKLMTICSFNTFNSKYLYTTLHTFRKNTKITHKQKGLPIIIFPSMFYPLYLLSKFFYPPFSG